MSAANGPAKSLTFMAEPIFPRGAKRRAFPCASDQDKGLIRARGPGWGSCSGESGKGRKTEDKEDKEVDVSTAVFFFTWGGRRRALLPWGRKRSLHTYVKSCVSTVVGRTWVD